MLGPKKQAFVTRGRMEEYLRLKEEQKALVAQINRFLEEWVEEEHPARVGSDTVINGFAYTGKMMRVVSVGIREKYNTLCFYARGRVLKKGDIPGTQSGEAEWEMKVRGN